jgi:hypothetical protein
MAKGAKIKTRVLYNQEQGMKPVIGVYVGWIPPEGKQWEPMYRTVRCPGGYQSDRTELCAPTIERYPGLKSTLSFYPNPLELPYALERRTPLNREDYEWDARFFNLPYPNADIFEFTGRSGGLMVADSFSVCPIVEPNEDGSYTYEVQLREVDKEVRDNFNETMQLKVIAHQNEPTIITADNRHLGELPPPFSYLGEEINNLKVVRISEAHYFMGRSVLVSFDTPVNLYATSNFVMASREAVGV